jgi:surface antigen
MPGLRAALAAAALALGGCSVPAQLGSGLQALDDEVTNSITSGATLAGLSATDLSALRAAAVAVLENDTTSGSWENPDSGARGTIRPVASPYRIANNECRDLLASHVLRDGDEAWLQVEACRNGFGDWEARQVKPWKRS